MRNAIILIAGALLTPGWAFTQGGEKQPNQQQSILKIAILQPIRKAPVPEVIGALATAIRGQGLIGFQQISEDKTAVSVNPGTPLGEALDAIVEKDHRYRILTTDISGIVNIIAATQDPNTKLLDLKVAKCDIVLDDWPQNWFMRLPDSCAEISSYLRNRYKELGGRSLETGGAGASMEGNIKPPHLEMHVVNKSVREVLNMLAGRSMTITGDPLAKAQPGTVVPSGWKYSVPDVNGMSFVVWQRHIFSSL